ncbi:cytochrome P450 [Favolaschia claudopus]|uniref:Cytochrome P450 n=1 Tax=Favolaschia claudopus TaxID=2862362 RepID=A0AAW0CTT7_9AGAR
MFSLNTVTLLSSLAAHLYFKAYEPTDLVQLIGLLVAPPVLLASLYTQLTLGEFLPRLFRSFLLYHSSLLLSILSYRISPLHPLSKYPGPIACKISKLWLAYVGSKGKLHIYVKSLHDKYGPVVRVGPNELSVIDVSLLPAIMGSNGMPKGPLWNGRTISRSGQKEEWAKEAARRNLIGARDPKNHAEARQTWNRAFSTAAIKGYEPVLRRRVTQLIEALAARKDASVDLSQWLSFFSLGGGFELMHDGDSHGHWQTLEAGMVLPTITQQIPWCLDFFLDLPAVGKEIKALAKFALNIAKKRAKDGSVHNDLFYYLIDDKRADSRPYPFPLAVSNAVVAIIAGVDTTATVLSNTFFFLITHPESYKRLQRELDEAFPLGSKEPTDSALLASLPYLNAVIKESSRVFPPVPTSLQRAPTPGSGGRLLSDGFFIPEGTSITVPPYTLHRQPEYFSPSPEQFIPERWLDESQDGTKGEKYIVNTNAYIPFSTGPANCAARNLAMLELRMVLASILQRFELRFADGYDTQQWEADLKDYFVLQKGRLPVVLIARVRV